jgi:hypothetical protein
MLMGILVKMPRAEVKLAEKSGGENLSERLEDRMTQMVGNRKFSQ